ncbi:MULTISPECIES: 23S rRNA pseudouridine(1911/1915/1917) synthase RluD [unclassified Oleiphilus]|jgi:23S rRNA pseudouridine1911/1915/1917 synthase|nr:MULTISPECIES: 23S rRNA pseudouridine(1911/1915/1917) synthase RluD [unclassified Oleiphilus]KZY46094.1 RNA pseudouridine synthase [Oleiphilus sp. HI0050]KZY74462.1 RNA pseudouridine synthase [Oleiphilus sp. HI0068]KZY77713.1 RNA pseudouridine synthase [Oleiphilus sp. HI0069]KZY89461.1 RNA pseudouridine synthase [Oleiphilus sp. HI0072]KZZ21609.1 RNA pseudouridine synthase [Oleiphilus sp. HI0081]KZZ32127.1 RNA pseudouridine synthase [Oleiphilus sp. HI0085]
MSQIIEADFVVPLELSGMRLDQVIADFMPEYSRSRLQQWIKQGHIRVNEEIARSKDKVKINDLIEVKAELESQGEWLAEDIPLDIVYQDEDILIINKPAGMVVHPAAGNHSGTLVNALLHHFPDIKAVPRAGIVHRLDKDTTGLMVVAKTLTAHAHIVEQLQSREMGREYEAIAAGVMTGGGTINEPIARSPKNRKKMAVNQFGKHAVTHYRVLERFLAHTHIRVKLETGRTHQIRVHMAHIKHPLIGDTTYAGRMKLPAGASDEVKNKLRQFERQALHAKKLTLIHPQTGEEMSWEVDLPEDMQNLLAVLSEQ